MGLNKDTSSWKTVKMKDIAIANNGIVDGPFGSNLKTTDYINDSINGVPVLTTKNLNGDFSDKSVRYISKNKFEKLKRSAVFPGDILVAKIGSIGKCCIYPPNQRIALIPANLLKITLREDYYIKYVYYYIQSPDFQALIKSITKATAQPAFNVTRFRELPISVPCYSEQLKIVQNLEESLSQLDSAVETLNKTKQQLEIYRQAVLKEAFSTINQMATIKSIAETRLGKMLDKEKNTGKARKYLRNINVRWFDFDLSDLLEMRIEDNEIDKYSIEKDDLVMCEGGEPGRCAVWNKEQTIFYQKALHRIRFSEKSNPYFYMYYFWLINQSGFLSKYFTGTGIKHLTGQSLAKVPIPICSREQQNKIVSYIENKVKLTANIETTIDQSLQQAEALRQSILKQAFEGK